MRVQWLVKVIKNNFKSSIKETLCFKPNLKCGKLMDK